MHEGTKWWTRNLNNQLKRYYIAVVFAPIIGYHVTTFDRNFKRSYVWDMRKLILHEVLRRLWILINFHLEWIILFSPNDNLFGFIFLFELLKHIYFIQNSDEYAKYATA